MLQTNQSYGKYADGYFEVKVKASNSPDPNKADFTYIKIFVLQDTDLMKFVFDKNPVQVHLLKFNVHNVTKWRFLGRRRDETVQD